VGDLLISFIADIHLDNFPKWGGPERGGLNDRARWCFSALEESVQLAACGPLIVLGDLFNRCQPSPALITMAQEILSMNDYSPESRNTHLLLGNHDQESGVYGHNALAPLSPIAQVHETPHVLRDYRSFPRGDLELWFCPYKPGSAKDWLPQQLETLMTTATKKQEYMGTPVSSRALCVHMGLSDFRTPYHLDETAGSMQVKRLAKLCKKFGITHVFAGDWHRHQVWNIDGVTLVQVGSLCPPRFPPGYEDAHKGPLVRWDGGDKIEVIDVPGPRFFKFRWSQLKNKPWTPPSSAVPAFVRVTCRTDQVDEAKEWVKALPIEHGLIGDGGLIGGVELDIDRGMERAKARTASFEARQASSLAEAIALYVKKMPVEKNVDRELVLKNVRRLLG